MTLRYLHQPPPLTPPPQVGRGKREGLHFLPRVSPRCDDIIEERVAMRVPDNDDGRHIHFVLGHAAERGYHDLLPFAPGILDYADRRRGRPVLLYYVQRLAQVARPALAPRVVKRDNEVRPGRRGEPPRNQLPRRQEVRQRDYREVVHERCAQ